MAFDERLAERVRKVLRNERSLKEKRMFGGLTFMVNGHMCCGVLQDDLVLRLGQEDYAKAVARPHAHPMDFTGRSMPGFLYVSPAGLQTARQLGAWIEKSLRFVSTLPPK
jgi:TfoX/Sxy family transcriptional regulator of competence genes